MEFRTLVKSGSTSYTITLPIDWIRKNDLEAGSKVSLKESSFGEILLQADAPKHQQPTSHATRDISSLTHEQIQLLIQTEYVKGTQQLTLTGELSADTKQAIDTFVSRLVGLEVLDQSDSVALKNFFSLDSQTNPKQMTRKMMQINKTSLTFLETFFEQGLSEEQVSQLQQYMYQVMRLSYAAEQAIQVLTKQPLRLARVQVSHLELVQHKIYVGSARRMAIYLYKMALSLQKVPTQTEHIPSFRKLFDSLQETHESLKQTISTPSEQAFQQVISQTRQIEKDAEVLFEKITHPHLLQSMTLIFSFSMEMFTISYEALLAENAPSGN